MGTIAPVMAKHKKKNLQQLIQKRQQLQNVITHTDNATITTSDHQNISISKELPEKKPEKVEQKLQYHGIEIRHTLVSLIVIIILLAISLYISHKTTYFSTFGSWLYTVLRLKS